jgi:hypothetical protein
MESDNEKRYLKRKPVDIKKKYQSLLAAVNKVTGLGANDILSRKRDRNHSMGRFAIVKILRDDHGLRFKTIGSLLKRHRTTIISHYDQHENYARQNTGGYRQLFQKIWYNYHGAWNAIADDVMEKSVSDIVQDVAYSESATHRRCI